MSTTNKIDGFVSKLKHPLKAEMEAVIKIIREAAKSDRIDQLIPVTLDPSCPVETDPVYPAQIDPSILIAAGDRFCFSN